jgi:hypothetical protein
MSIPFRVLRKRLENRVIRFIHFSRPVDLLSCTQVTHRELKNVAEPFLFVPTFIL